MDNEPEEDLERAFNHFELAHEWLEADALQWSEASYGFLSDGFRVTADHCFRSVTNQKNLADKNACHIINDLIVAILPNARSVIDDSIYAGPEEATIAACMKCIAGGLLLMTSLMYGNEENRKTFIEDRLTTTVFDCLFLYEYWVVQGKVARSNKIIVSTGTSVEEGNSLTDQSFVELVENGLRVVENLALDATTREELGALGTCAMAVRFLRAPALGAHDNHIVVAENCLAALSNLALQNETNVKMIVDSHGCFAILDVIRKFALGSVYVADYALWTLEALASQDSRLVAVEHVASYRFNGSKSTADSARHKDKLTYAGSRIESSHIDQRQQNDPEKEEDGSALKMLMQVMRIYVHDSVTIAESGLGAICAIVLQNDAMMEQFLLYDGFTLVMSVLHMHGESSAEVVVRGFRLLTGVVHLIRRYRKELKRRRLAAEAEEAEEQKKRDEVLAAIGYEKKEEEDAEDEDDDFGAPSLPVGSSKLVAQFTVMNKTSTTTTVSPVPNKSANTGINNNTINNNSFVLPAPVASTAVSIGVGSVVDMHLAMRETEELQAVVNALDICVLLMDAENGTLESKMVRRKKHRTANTVSVAASKFKTKLLSKLSIGARAAASRDGGDTGGDGDSRSGKAESLDGESVDPTNEANSDPADKNNGTSKVQHMKEQEAAAAESLEEEMMAAIALADKETDANDGATLVTAMLDVLSGSHSSPASPTAATTTTTTTTTRRAAGGGTVGLRSPKSANAAALGNGAGHPTAAAFEAAAAAGVRDIDSAVGRNAETYPHVWRWVLHALEHYEQRDSKQKHSNLHQSAVPVKILHQSLLLLTTIALKEIESWKEIGNFLHAGFDPFLDTAPADQLGRGCAILLKAMRGAKKHQSDDNNDGVDSRRPVGSNSDDNTLYVTPHNLELDKPEQAESAQLCLETLLQLASSLEEHRGRLCRFQAHEVVVALLASHGATAGALYTAELAFHTFALLYDQIGAQEANEGNRTACQATLESLRIHSCDNSSTSPSPSKEGVGSRGLAAAGPMKGGSVVIGESTQDESSWNSRKFTARRKRTLQLVENGMRMVKHLAFYAPNQQLLGDHKGCPLIVQVLRAHALGRPLTASASIFDVARRAAASAEGGGGGAGDGEGQKGEEKMGGEFVTAESTIIDEPLLVIKSKTRNNNNNNNNNNHSKNINHIENKETPGGGGVATGSASQLQLSPVFNVVDSLNEEEEEEEEEEREDYTNHSLIAAMYGLDALAYLSAWPENQARIAKCGGCKLICDLVKEYGETHPPLAETGLRSFSALAISNRGMLGELGACGVVMQLVKHYITAHQTHNESIASLTATSIFNLSFQYPDNKTRFLALDLEKEMRIVLSDRQLTHPTRDLIKDAINMVRFN